MIRIIDTYQQIPGLFDRRAFQYEKWREYANAIYPDAAHLFEADVAEYIDGETYLFERDFLPVIENVCGNPKLEALHESFLTVTDCLNSRIMDIFGQELDADIVLYLGLCNAAGWVTEIDGANVVFLGVEKIIELDWCDQAAMSGLIFHELGHIFHKQHGRFTDQSDDRRKNFVWQLFTEGIAMVFEQALAGDPEFFHQDHGDWKAWCDGHISQIAADFHRDLATMTRQNQRYFGDWCDYCGHGDVGYYLGTRFVQSLMETRPFHDLIQLDIHAIYALYLAYIQTVE